MCLETAIGVTTASQRSNTHTLLREADDAVNARSHQLSSHFQLLRPPTCERCNSFYRHIPTSQQHEFSQRGLLPYPCGVLLLLNLDSLLDALARAPQALSFLPTHGLQHLFAVTSIACRSHKALAGDMTRREFHAGHSGAGLLLEGYLIHVHNNCRLM